MITFLTGKPGAGKTLRAFTLARAAQAQGITVYAKGIEGLDSDATGILEWEHDLSEWQSLPPKSMLIVDEAQQWLSLDKVGRSWPDWLEAMTRARHAGVHLVFITQDPKFLHPVCRRLCNQHQHVVRKFDTEMAAVYTWGELCEDVSRMSWRKRATAELWRYPREDFDKYTSAEVHTVKARIPRRLVYAGLSVVLFVGLVWFAWSRLTGGAHDVVAGAGSAVGDLAGKLGVGEEGASVGAADQWRSAMTAEAYVQRLIPRIPGQPWSAPVFDDRRVVAEPEIYCVAVENAGCTCYTEQVTRLLVPVADCRNIARHGVYNPYREPFGRGEWDRGSGGGRWDGPQSGRAVASVRSDDGQSDSRAAVYRPINPAGEGAGTW